MDYTIPDPAATLERIGRFCASRERSVSETEQKLREWKVPDTKIRPIMEKLMKEGFLDDSRFASCFAASKFRHGKWGRLKIAYALRASGIDSDTIHNAMKGIPEEEYRDTLRSLILKKKREIKAGKNLNIREKIFNFVTGKGFETSLVAETLNELNI